MKAILNENKIQLQAGERTVDLLTLDENLMTNDLDNIKNTIDAFIEYEKAIQAAEQRMAELLPTKQQPKQRRRRRTKAEMAAARAAEAEEKAKQDNAAVKLNEIEQAEPETETPNPMVQKPNPMVQRVPNPNVVNHIGPNATEL